MKNFDICASRDTIDQSGATCALEAPGPRWVLVGEAATRPVAYRQA